MRRFCSKCGEQIKARRASPLFFGPLCAACAPHYRRARFLLIAAIPLCAAIVFAMGRYTAPREPFYFIGTPLDLNSIRSQPQTNQNGVVSSDVAAPREQQTDSSQRLTEPICGAPTRSGKPCQRKVKDGGYCWQHRDKLGAKKMTSSVE